MSRTFISGFAEHDDSGIFASSLFCKSCGSVICGTLDGLEQFAAMQAHSCQPAGSTEADILAFCESRWGEKESAQIGLKLAEESGEVAGALVKIPEGRATGEDLDDEVGDVLIVLSQIAAKRGKTLQDLRAARFQHIKARAAGKTQAL